jgi:endonuclease YncB( thermonuclease family)
MRFPIKQTLCLLILVLISCSETQASKADTHQQTEPATPPPVVTSSPELLERVKSEAMQAILPSPSLVPVLEQDPALVLGIYLLSTRLAPVVDGDTIRVDGLDKSLRLVGLDTEEVFKDDGSLLKQANADWPAYLAKANEGSDPKRPPKYGKPMGEASKVFAEEFFKGIKEVRLEYDHPKKKRGYYHRHLVHILAQKDGTWVNYNVEAVRMGHTPYFVKYGKCNRYHAAFVAAEAEARAHKRGIWGEPPTHSCYPDYSARLKWWAERDAALDRMAKRKETQPEIFVLDDDEDFNRLKTMVGKRVTVAGSLDGSRLDKKESSQLGSIGIIYLSHRMNDDFAIVGPVDQVEGHAIRANGGNLLLVTGTVSLHRGAPQFALDTISFEVL